MEQLLAYAKYVRSDRQLFKDAYRQTCHILCQFHDIASRGWGSPRPLDRLLSDVANGARLEVDVEPRLLIIEDETPKRNWEHHRRKTDGPSGRPSALGLSRPGHSDGPSQAHLNSRPEMKPDLSVKTTTKAWSVHRALGSTASWSLYGVGHLVSIPMLRWDLAVLYPLSRAVMLAVGDIQGESGPGPWGLAVD